MYTVTAAKDNSERINWGSGSKLFG